MRNSTITIEMAGREYPAEVSYELMPAEQETPTAPGYPVGIVVYSVELMDRKAGPGEWWYDSQGVARTGPAWRTADITDILDDHQAAVIKQQVINLLSAVGGLRQAA